jgi:hypothetical protein
VNTERKSQRVKQELQRQGEKNGWWLKENIQKLEMAKE